jgi:hypothetical protein
MKYLHNMGLDKAENNASLIYIKHICLQALEWLMGNDFQPCMAETTWSLPTSILDQIIDNLKLILLESPPQYNVLPYLTPKGRGIHILDDE